MRTECYERDLTENGYTVLASRRIGEYCDTKAEPLKMWLDKGDEVFWPGFTLTADSDLPLRRPADLPDYPDNPLPPETDIFTMDSEELSQEERDEVDFCKNWYDILRGKRQDWQCSGFRVFAGLVEIYFVRPETGGIAFLWLKEANGLRLHFECPKTRLGFTPSYKVTISRQTTRVEEDQGYMMREIRFMLKDPSKGVDSDVDNQRIAVTEAVGI